MKHYINKLLFIISMIFFIIFSYTLIHLHFRSVTTNNIFEYFSDSSIRDKLNKSKNIKPDSQKNTNNSSLERSIWISYMEFSAYQKSVNENTEESFRKFYGHILKKCASYHITNIIVQVRPFADALYPSKYFPWSQYISGTQGEALSYDPLQIMTEMTHKYNMTIEAWINPYRVCYDSNISSLSDANPAKKWMKDSAAKNNILYYNGCYYFNPAIEDVQSLIVNGVDEIVQNYDIDGIHMDDYFYPTFSEDNIKTSFDAYEYKSQYYKGELDEDMSIADWRRENVNTLVKSIYKSIKEEDPDVLFGISPQGNLTNLRSDLMNYVDIDRWIEDGNYVDYIMPQIYWGFTSKEAPFNQTVDQWTTLCSDSSVSLKIGIQFYRLGDGEKNRSDYKEYQSADCIKNQMDYLEKATDISGIAFFSYQYLDFENKNYDFETTGFPKNRKKILNELCNLLEEHY